MGQKDMTEKLLEEYNDVFADIVNVLLFDGKEVVSPEALQPQTVKSQYKADDGQLHEEERDVAKYWKEKKIEFAVLGIENQTAIEKEMPLRIIGYDGAAYRSQLIGRDKKTKKKPLYPVVTIILYFGKKRWKHSKNLKDVLNVPPELDKYVNDYHIHVFEIAWLSDETIKKFKSDFRVVAEYFVQTRKHQEYQPTPMELEHVDALLKLLSVFSGSDEFVNLVNTGESRRVTKMSDAIEIIKEKSIEQGVEQGIKQGIIAYIELLIEYNEPKEKIIDKTMKKFNLSKNDTLNAYKLFLNEKENS